MPRRDRLFQVLECINDNAYKIDLLGEYDVSATFNVTDLSPFNFNIVADSRMNHLEEGGNDTTKEPSKLIKLTSLNSSSLGSMFTLEVESTILFII